MSHGPLLLAPLRLEAAALRRGSRSLEVEQIGMGPVRATAARARLSARDLGSRPIVLAGIGGGLVRDLAAGDIVVATSVGSTESEERVQLPGAADLAQHLDRAGLTVRLAPVVSSPRILRGAEHRDAAALGGAHVVEMEALWLTPLAEHHRFDVVRVVFDAHDAEKNPLSSIRAAQRSYRALRDVARALESYAPIFGDHPSGRSR